jgi:hypothetical protein
MVGQEFNSWGRVDHVSFKKVGDRCGPTRYRSKIKQYANGSHKIEDMEIKEVMQRPQELWRAQLITESSKILVDYMGNNSQRTFNRK